MTTAPRQLTTPRLEARQFAVRVTAAASHASTLAELANDAAGGHPSQRMTVPRLDATAVVHTYWLPTVVPRFLRVVALVTASDVTLLGSVVLKLSITDSLGGTVAFSAPEIPDGLDGGSALRSSYSTTYPSRLGSGGRGEWLLDVDALDAAGLDLAATWWRFAWSATVTSPCVLEYLAVDEVPRFLVDDAETFGQLGATAYRPRGIVVDGSPLGLQRLWPTVRTGLLLGLRTYHCTLKPENDPWLVTSTSLTTFGGSDQETAGVSAVYRVRPRAMRAGVDTRVRFILRYKLSGASPGDTATVRLTTGAGTFDAVLTDVTATWVDSAWTTATLDAVTEDRLVWSAKVSNGASTLRVITRVVVDYPEA
jgi:hypothetical protein